ncbi:P-loop domain-containing protein [Dubosiella newyorkensis]|uniref:P-loop domain-containing protein n=1 Tax=Dubosiella newyorkensis TaxID=1862672 RepID=UPI003F67A7BA
MLMDEDTSAGQFMVRDALMQKVVHRDKSRSFLWWDRIEQLVLNGRVQHDFGGWLTWRLLLKWRIL